MIKERLESYVLTLGNVGIALSQVEVKGETNLNYLLAAIQEIRKVKKGLKECANHDDHNEQREEV